MIGDVFRVAYLQKLFGQLIVNTFGYRQSTANATVNSDQSELATAFQVNIVDAIANATAAGLTAGTLEVRTVPPFGDPITGVDIPLVVAGNREDPPCPPTVAVVIRRRTSFLGRRFRGRIYIAGIAAADQASGVIAGVDPLANFAAVAAAIGGPIASANVGAPSFEPVLIGRIPAQRSLPQTGWLITPITSADKDNTLRSQRRREIGRGD